MEFNNIKNGTIFEQLCRELLICMGFEVHWTGEGQDSGRDLIAIEKVEGILAPFKRKWLVNCKHNTKSGKAVGINDILNIKDACTAVEANGFLLICSTHPTAALVRRLEELNSKEFVTRYWDSIELINRLTTPETLYLVKLFLPEDKINVEWKIYGTFKPSLWGANYKGLFFYIQSRTNYNYPDLKDIEEIIKKIEKWLGDDTVVRGDPLDPFEYEEKIYLRPRLISYNNKADTYSVDLDLICPKTGIWMSSESIEKGLDSGSGLYIDSGGESTFVYFNVRIRHDNQISDHFHPDHKEYYDEIFKQIAFS